MSTLIVVDGPNVYNDVARLLEADDLPSQYFSEWFDIDRLVCATLLPQRLDPYADLGIVCFHSRKSLGTDKRPCRIGGEEAVARFWTRQGSNPSSSAMLVDVPGARQGKETGIDISIVVYLYETEDQWQRAVLFTGDADFVPAVWSLRRRGKRVYCAGRPEFSTGPLAAACQHFSPWDIDFLRSDAALFQALAPGAAVDKFLLNIGNLPKIRVKIAGDAFAISGQNVVANVALLEKAVAHSCLKVDHSATEIGLRALHAARHPHGEHVIQGALRHAAIFSEAAWFSCWNVEARAG